LYPELFGDIYVEDFLSCYVWITVRRLEGEIPTLWRKNMILLEFMLWEKHNLLQPEIVQPLLFFIIFQCICFMCTCQSSI